MQRRQPLPRLWLITDERQGERLWDALERLPRGSGVVFRHYSLGAAERRALFARVRNVARRRGLMLLSAGRRLPGADGVHNGPGRGLVSASAHSLAEIRRARRRGARVVFLSPVFATRSHPGAPPLGPERFSSLAWQAGMPVIALGGMDRERADGLAHAYGWAAIDALTN